MPDTSWVRYLEEVPDWIIEAAEGKGFGDFYGLLSSHCKGWTGLDGANFVVHGFKFRHLGEVWIKDRSVPDLLILISRVERAYTRGARALDALEQAVESGRADIREAKVKAGGDAQAEGGDP
ncbi:hypothetical protein [Bailinhaonella thermotolerans]|uniref:Uncharacterized protein n=1 Tax=Bailinhaonella thermotolerans TaxID=1070861 RepID=A0A3A4AT74_9ACTN|nr:hypothetical protein [Bailinhaonella thermotolerans]RJL32563.1 hypothetical protein D5H75_13665 [Bailinhaonella thermotolerans]